MHLQALHPLATPIGHSKVLYHFQVWGTEEGIAWVEEEFFCLKMVYCRDFRCTIGSLAMEAGPQPEIYNRSFFLTGVQ